MRAYINGQIFTGDTLWQQHAVLAENGRVSAVVPVSAVPAGVERIDLGGGLLAPAFLDIQIYGGNGHLFGEFPSVEALAATVAYSRAGGAVACLPTVATNSGSVMRAAIDAVRAYWAGGGRGVPGLHLEGPYIHPDKRGAHLAEFIRKPELNEVKELLAYGKGVIKMMTLAPECCSDEVVNFLLQEGIVVSAGHSNASYAQAVRAFDRGIRTATHLFNAMSALQHRAPGMVGAILDHPGVSVSVVADGFHVDYAAIRIAKKVLQERLFLITDAVTENTGGAYSHRLDGDRYVVADGTLSGSALTMWKAVQNCVRHADIPLEEALRMAALYPARVIGSDHIYGKIERHFAESFVVLKGDEVRLITETV